MSMEHMTILLAGGRGQRMGSAFPDKVLTDVGGRPLFEYLLRAFVRSGIQDGFVVVYRDQAQRIVLEKLCRPVSPEKPVHFVQGGRERRDSVLSGLAALPSETRFVYIHDAARAAVTPEALTRVRAALESGSKAVSLAHRISDTVRRFAASPLEEPVDGELLDRNGLWAMETPQGFQRTLIEEAHARFAGSATDDLAAVEAMGLPVRLIENPHPNPKLTRSADLPAFATLLQSPSMEPYPPSPRLRVGNGYDIHRLKEGLPLVLGGVSIPSDHGLEGHSDADVLTHALADAILGACGLPDIGTYFPNTDPACKGMDSQLILRKACEEASAKGFNLVNADLSIIAEKPKLGPHVAAMKTALSRTLGLGPEAIGIKATTHERIGALGQGAGIAAYATVLLAGVNA